MKPLNIQNEKDKVKCNVKPCVCRKKCVYITTKRKCKKDAEIKTRG